MPAFRRYKTVKSDALYGIISMNAEDLRRRANQYREIVRKISDARTIEALNELADKYEAEAAEAQVQSDLDDQC
jgi:hypothetical protein